jgi:hypothetical protein
LLAPGAWDTKAADKIRVNLRVAPMTVDPSGGHPAMDYPEHMRTYAGFLRGTVILIVLVTVILAFLLTLVP